MQVAQAFREIDFEGRSPQAVLNCLQDVSSTNYLRPRVLIIRIKLLEHAPASLSQRIKNRLVHTAISLTKTYDIQPERLVLKNHLQLCGGAAVDGGGFADVWKGLYQKLSSCTLCPPRALYDRYLEWRGGMRQGHKGEPQKRRCRVKGSFLQ